jgi:hypothetical protein
LITRIGFWLFKKVGAFVPPPPPQDDFLLIEASDKFLIDTSGDRIII